MKHINEFLYKANFTRVERNHFKNDKCEVFTDRMEVIKRGKSFVFTDPEKMKEYLIKLITVDQFDYEP